MTYVENKLKSLDRLLNSMVFDNLSAGDLRDTVEDAQAVAVEFVDELGEMLDGILDIDESIEQIQQMITGKVVEND